MEEIKTLLKFCPVPMVVVNKNNKTCFINESFTQALGYDIEDLPDVTQWFSQAFPTDDNYRQQQITAWRDACSGNKHGRKANVICKNGSTRVVEIYGANIGQQNNLIILLDITEKDKDNEEFCEEELNEQISKMSPKKGLLPICSFCNKVRFNYDSWETVAAPVLRHLHDKVTHGVCPNCIKEHYPDLSFPKPEE